MQRVLIYLRDTADAGLFYAPGAASFEIYSDANWAERQSTAGALFYFNGCLVAWYSRLQRSACHSTAEAEYVGASMAAREGIFYRETLVEFGALLGLLLTTCASTKGWCSKSLTMARTRKLVSVGGGPSWS